MGLASEEIEGNETERKRGQDESRDGEWVRNGIAERQR